MILLPEKQDNSMSEQLSCDPISFDKSFNIHKRRTVAKFSYGEQILKKKKKKKSKGKDKE